MENKFGNYVISGSCKTMAATTAAITAFGNYVISGSCKTAFHHVRHPLLFGNYVISGSCKTNAIQLTQQPTVWELCDFWKL